MKNLQLLKSDYIVILLAWMFFGWMIYENGSIVILIFLAAVPIVFAVVIGFRSGFRSLQKAEDSGAVDSFMDRLDKIVRSIIGVFIPGVIALAVTWFFIKVLISSLRWLKDGYWSLYDYQTVCSVFNFSCYPATSFVKINEFLAWIYGFEVTLFVVAAGIVSIVFLGLLSNTDNNVENRN